jgi:hypothetical protein
MANRVSIGSMILNSTAARFVRALSLASVALLVGCGNATQTPATLTLPGMSPPLNDATIGEELVLSRGATEWRYTVIEAGDTHVKVEVMRYVDGTPDGKPERFRWHRNGFGVPDDAVIRRIERGRIDAGGRAWSCWILHVFTRDRGNYYYWLSDEVGVHGIVKIAKSADEGIDDRHALYWTTDSLSSQ